MTAWGYTLSSEEHHPNGLVDLACRAEALGFEFVSVSDHFHPWLRRQGNSPFVWATIGGIAARTERIRVGSGVTCPIIRMHPAVVAHAAATVAVMLGDRFFLGVGSGEALNEHVAGARWPMLEERLEMLDEATQIMRQLWTGEVVDHVGRHYVVDNAVLCTVPAEPPPIIVSAFGSKAAEVAARIGDGLWTSSVNPEPVSVFRDSGGEGPVYGQLTLCWAEDEAVARKIAHEMWPSSSLPGQLAQEVATPMLFEQACELVTEDMVAENVLCGPDPGPVVDQLHEFVAAGYTHVHLHQIGPDQEGFFRFWEERICPAL